MAPVNPYTSRPVTDAAYYVAAHQGRGAQAQRLLQALVRRDPQPDSISLIGDRRFGKTSMLYYLRQEVAIIDPDRVVLSVDMLTLPEQTSEGFYKMLARALVRAGELPAGTHILNHLDFVDFLDGLRDSGRSMILFIDEFDCVARDRRFTPEFFDNLRSCASVEPLTLVIASVARLSTVAHSALYGSPFFNIFNIEALVPLSLTEAHSLIHEPPRGVRNLSDVTDEILALAGCHPFFLQQACRLALEIYNTEGGHDVAALRRAFATSSRDHFHYTWDHVTASQKSSIRSLALGLPVDDAILDHLVERGYAWRGPPPEIASSAFKQFVIERTHENPSSDVYPEPTHAFISYSHKDRRILNEIRTMLAPLLRNGSIKVWDDTKIKSGGTWDDEIQAALAHARLALLLVSDNFLSSEYIQEHELPIILEAVENRGVTLVWVLVSPCLYLETRIASFQAAHDVSKPLASLNMVERKATLQLLCEAIKAAFLRFDTPH